MLRWTDCFGPSMDREDGSSYKENSQHPSRIMDFPWEGQNFFPAFYQRVRIDCIQRNQRDKKKERAVLEKRLRKLIVMPQEKCLENGMTTDGCLITDAVTSQIA